MIIQNKSHLNDIIDKNIQSEVVIIPTLCDKNLHPKRNQLSLLYLKWLSTNDENIIVLNHSEKRKDNDLNIDWKLEGLNPILSNKDKQGVAFKDADYF